MIVVQTKPNPPQTGKKPPCWVAQLLQRNFNDQLKGTYKVRGEPPVKLTLSQDSSLPRSTSETNLKKVGEKDNTNFFLPPSPLATEPVQCKSAGTCIIP